MPIRLAILFIIACAITAVVAAPRLDVVCLVQKAVNLNSNNHQRWSCLHYAAARGDTGVMLRMLDYGADVGQRNADGRTPLAEAAKSGQLESTKLLLNEGAEVNVYDTESGFTPLHLAAQYNHPAVTRRLISAGADVNARNQWQQTPLWQAAWQDWHGNTEVAHILIANGGQIELADDKGNTPLHMAARAGHTPMVKYLIAQSAEVSHANDKGRTPLYQAVIGNHLEAAAMLLEHGANPDVQVDDWTPLRVALEDNHLEMADLLNANGAQGYEKYAAGARLNKGFRLLQDKDFENAIKVLDAAVAENPKEARAYYYRGMAHYEQGHGKKAMRDLVEALTLEPNYPGALESLGELYTELGEFQRAQDTLNKLVEQRPNYGRGYYLLARSQSGLGDDTQASKGHIKSCSLGYRPACNEPH